MDKIVSEPTPELTIEDGVKVGTLSISHHGVEEMAKMWEFKKNNDLCDACLLSVSDNTKILAHRLVLSAASDYFHRIFKTNTEGVQFVAPLEDVSNDVLLKIVEFVYTGEIKLTEENVENILKWSVTYQLPKLTSLCEKFLMLNMDFMNLSKYKELSSTYACETLREKVDQFIDDNFMGFHQSEVLQETYVDELSEILSRNSLHCESEKNVFDTVVRWLKFDPKQREQQLMKLVPCIRFSLLSQSFIFQHADAFKGNSEAFFYCFKAAEWHTLSNEQKKLKVEFCDTPRIVSRNLISKEHQSTVMQPYAYSTDGFYTYNIADKIWTKVYTVNDIEIIYSKNGNQILFKKRGSDDFFLADIGDPSQTEKVIRCPDHNGVKFYAPATCIVETQIYFIGGVIKNYILTNEVFVFDHTTKETKCIAPMKVARSAASAILVDNCIYVVGGQFFKYLCDVEKYDIKTNEWSTMAPLLHEGHSFELLIHDEMLYVFGSGKVQRYDFMKNEWSVFSDLPLHGYVSNALMFGDDFFVTAFDSNDLYQYDKKSANWVKRAGLPSQY